MALHDIFLKLETARAGPLRGESVDPDHVGEIDILDWSWGMASPYESGGFQATGRVQIQPVRLIKQADTASTGLMSALRTNDTVKKAVLTMRKAGGPKAVNFFTVTLEDGRVLSVNVRSERDESGTPGLLEEITLGFTRIRVEYRSQDAKGSGQGVTTYSDELNRAA